MTLAIRPSFSVYFVCFEEQSRKTTVSDGVHNLWKIGCYVALTKPREEKHFVRELILVIFEFIFALFSASKKKVLGSRCVDKSVH